MKKYKFDDEDKSIQPVPIIITEGKYEGVKIQYGRIAFDENDGKMELNFDYNLMENPGGCKEDQEFIDALGQTLVHVLEEEMEVVGDDFLREVEKPEEEEVVDEDS
tara:strand:- start:757 stop:1074 length:318 start_codon:yes stop_codon:yes gene_type:complete